MTRFRRYCHEGLRLKWIPPRRGVDDRSRNGTWFLPRVFLAKLWFWTPQTWARDPIWFTTVRTS